MKLIRALLFFVDFTEFWRSNRIDCHVNLRGLTEYNFVRFKINNETLKKNKHLVNHTPMSYGVRILTHTGKLF